MVTKQRVFLTKDETSTRALGAALGHAAYPGAVILLRGRLGAGKTAFAKGIAQGLGITERVVSPSFTLVREYAGPDERPGMVHMDFYRLSGADEVSRLGVDEFLTYESVLVVEWPDRGAGVLGDEAVSVTIHHEATAADDIRRIVMVARGDSSQALIDALDVPHDVGAA